MNPRYGYVTDTKISDTETNTRSRLGTEGTGSAQMANKTDKRVAQEPLTYSIPVAGGMAGLARNASYAAARRGEIPVMDFGWKKRVPGAKWRRILAEGREPSNAE
jgi:hypothetical protein